MSGPWTACRARWRACPPRACTCSAPLWLPAWVAPALRAHRLWHQVRKPPARVARLNAQDAGHQLLRARACKGRALPSPLPTQRRQFGTLRVQLGARGPSPQPPPRRAAHPAESLKQAAKFAGAAAGAAIGAAITVQLKAKRQSAAIIELANTLVSLGDPTALTREQVGAGWVSHEQLVHSVAPTLQAGRLQLPQFGTVVGDAYTVPGRLRRAGGRHGRTGSLTPLLGPDCPWFVAQVAAVEAKYGVNLAQACTDDLQVGWGRCRAAGPQGCATCMQRHSSLAPRRAKPGSENRVVAPSPRAVRMLRWRRLSNASAAAWATPADHVWSACRCAATCSPFTAPLWRRLSRRATLR